MAQTGVKYPSVSNQNTMSAAETMEISGKFKVNKEVRLLDETYLEKLKNPSLNVDRVVTIGPDGRLKEGPPVDVITPIGGGGNGGNNNPPGGASWLLNGNHNVSASHFLGTANYAPLIFKTNNIERLRIDENGNIIVQGNISSPNIASLTNSVANLQGTVSSQQTEISNIQLEIAAHDSALAEHQSEISNLNTHLSNLVSSQWKNDSTAFGDIYYEAGNVKVYGTFQASEINTTQLSISDKFTAPSGEFDTVRAEKYLAVNHNLRLGRDLGTTESDIASKTEALVIQSEPLPAGMERDVIVVADNEGKVGVGTRTPTEKLSVEGSIKASGTITSGTGFVFPDGTMQTTAATGNGSGNIGTTVDSITVTGKIKAARIVPLDADSVIRFGNNTMSIWPEGHQIYLENISNYLIKGIKIGNVRTTALDNNGLGQAFFQLSYGLYSTAIGYNLRTSENANYSIVLGSGMTTGTFSSADPVLQPGTLVNNVANSLMIGFNSNIPTLFVGPSNGANTTGNVGIGNSNPQAKLDVSGNGHFSGNLGVGTPSPNEKLEVVGYGRFGQAGNNYVRIGFNGANGLIDCYDNIGPKNLLINYYSGGNVTIGGGPGGSSDLTVMGNMGVGKAASSAYKMEVAGTLRVCKVEVEVLSGCDFVFEKDYVLLPLKKRRETVLQNKHLLNIRPAKQMEQNGADLGETSLGLLRNLEEHELYLYNHEERIEKLEKENAELRKIIIELLSNNK